MRIKYMRYLIRKMKSSRRQQSRRSALFLFYSRFFIFIFADPKIKAVVTPVQT